MKKIIIGVAALVLAMFTAQAQTVTTSTTNQVVSTVLNPVVTTTTVQTGNLLSTTAVTNMVASFVTNQVVSTTTTTTQSTGTPAVPVQTQVPNLLGSLGVNVSGINISSISSLLQNGLVTVGTPFAFNGQSFLVTTNAAGQYVIYTTGPAGTATVNQPTSVTGALTTMGQYVAANNPTNANFYGTNEIAVGVGMVYLQNSGQAAVEISLEKYGLLSSVSQLGLGVALFQGNNAGKSGTAGAVGFVDYRKIIGDVSVDIGAGAGYDNWNSSIMGVVKCDITLRQNHYLEEYAGVAYAFEGKVSGPGGLIVRAGVRYAFSSLNPFAPTIKP